MERLYSHYISVERQVTTMWDENLDLAVDTLLEHPDLARQLVHGVAAAPAASRRSPPGPFAPPPPPL